MPLPAPFRIERYFARHEFTAPHLLSPSDCETMSLAELLALAEADGRRRWESLSLGYTESAGHPALRQEIASACPGLDPDDTLVVSPIEGIYLAMNALLEPGDHVIVMSPAYQALLEVARSAGAEVEPWPLVARQGRWHADLDRLRSLLRPNTRMLVTNLPHNPTGYLPDRATFDAIAGLVRDRGLLWFADEMYRGLEPDPALQLPSATERHERAIVLSGLSKAAGLPGLRIGWLASKDRTALERCQTLKDYTTICHSAPSEILALIALRARATLLERSRAIVGANVALARAFFGARPDRFEWLEPDAGSVAFPRWTGPAPVEAMAQRALERAGLMLAAGELFDLPGTHFRVGLGRRGLARALERLDLVAAA